MAANPRSVNPRTDTDKLLSKTNDLLRSINSILYSVSLPGAPIQFKIGDGNPLTPANGATAYVNANLAPYKRILVYLQGTGYLTLTTQYTVDSTGGFTLVGSTFATNQVYLVFPYLS